jgi:hypothetical protein
MNDEQSTGEQKTHQEEFKVSGDDIVKKIKELLHEGNIRRIIIKNDQGNILMEIPLTFAIVGTVLAPVLAAIGALAAVMTEYSIVVVRKE